MECIVDTNKQNKTKKVLMDFKDRYCHNCLRN